MMGTLSVHAAAYLKEKRKQGRYTRGTMMRASYVLRGLDESFGNRPMEAFGTRAIERWIEQNTDWNAATRRTHLSTVKVFTRWLIVRRIIQGDPFAEIDPIKVPRPVPRPFNREDIDTLLEGAPDTRSRLIVMLMFSMGLRCIGVANLRVEDIDYVSKVLIVKEKFGNERRLPITPSVMSAIRSYLADCPARTGPLVRSQSRRREHDGLSAQYISASVGRLMKEAGVKHYAGDGRNAHALRHTALTNLAEATGDAFLVQELAGWASAATASHYVRRASTERLREALVKRDEVH